MLRKPLNAKLAIVICFIIFIVYMFVLASIFYGFPPDNSIAKVPSTYATLLGVGLIILGWVSGSFAFIDAKNKIFPLTRWGKIWISSAIIFVASFSISMFSNFIIGALGITLISSIVWLASSFFLATSYRRLENKTGQQENNGKEKQAMAKNE
jgi:hypothetical protein